MEPKESLSPRGEQIVSAMLYSVVASILLVAWLPTANWIVPVVAAIRVWLWQGFWPHYGHPDPKDLPQHFGPIPEWVEYAVPLAAVVALVAISIWAMRHALPKRWWLWASLLVWPLAWAAAFAVMLADPGGIFEWFFD